MLCWKRLTLSAFKKTGFLYFENQTRTEIISVSLQLYIDIQIYSDLTADIDIDIDLYQYVDI